MDKVNDTKIHGVKTNCFSLVNRFLVLILFAASLITTFYVSKNFQNFELNHFDEASITIDNWNVTADGEKFSYQSLPIICPVQEKLELTYHLEEFPSIYLENYSLKLKTNYSDIRAYIDNELIYSYPEPTKENSAFGNSTPQAIHFIPISSNDFGKNITIELFPTGNDESVKIYEGELTTKSKSLNEYVQKEIIPFVIDSLIFCFGIGLIIAAVFLRKKVNSMVIFWLGLFLITYGIWDVTFVDSTLIFLPQPYLNYIVSYMSYSFLPIPLLYFLFFVNKKRHRLLFNLLISFCLSIAFITFILHITSIKDYQELYFLINISVVSGGLFSLIIILIDYFRYRDSGKYFLIGIIIFIALVLIDMSVYLFGGRNRINGLMNFGLLCFAICYLIDIVLMSVESIFLKRNYHLLEEAAYKDSLTQIENRRAFDKKVSEIEQKGYAANVQMILFDTNNLKKLNDTQGHQKGDEMLIEMAQLLKKYFGHIGLVYRIGGDEFIVLCENVAMDELQLCLRRFQNDVNECDTCNVSTAYGCASWEENDTNLYNVFNRAEEKMYSYKNAMKKG